MGERETDIVIWASPFDASSGASHHLLRQAAARYTGRNAEDWPLAFGEKGKPYFPTEPQVQFSITHSGEYWMCAFSQREVGLDLQVHQLCQKEKLSRRFFHPTEDAFLRRKNYEDFFDLWSAKESYLKFTGQGITDELESFSVVAGERFPSVEDAWLHLLPWKDGYSMCLCAREVRTWVLAEL